MVKYPPKPSICIQTMFFQLLINFESACNIYYIRPREDIEVFPQTIATGYNASENQVTFLFICTEKYHFYAKKRCLIMDH